MNRCPPGVDSSFFSIPVLPGQRRQRHDPSRSFPVDLRCQHGATRFTQVGLPFPVLQGSPRLFLTCQKPPERPPVHPGPSGIIPVHHGGLRFNPRYSPVHPGPWTGVNRGVPGAQWDWGIRSDTKLTEGGSHKLMNCSASHMFMSRGLHVPIAPVLETLCYNYA